MFVYKFIVVFCLIIVFGMLYADFTGENQFGTSDTRTIAWGDYDGDGDIDLAVGNQRQQNKLYINNGDGTFSEEDLFGEGYTCAVVWGDYDNDGDMDLAVGGRSEQNHLYVNEGDGTFTEEDQFGEGNTYSLAWCDYDEDGDLDLAVGNYNQNYLYINNADGTFSQQEQFGIYYSRSVVWGDYDNDGDSDLAVGNGLYYPCYLYINNGDETFLCEEQFEDENTSSLAWGDYDLDKDLDLAVGNDGQNRLFINNGDGTFSGEDQFTTFYTKVVAWGDYDNDGSLDLAVGNRGQQNFLFTNNGDGTFNQGSQFGSGCTYSMVWGDYDLDGDLDMAVGNYDDQNNRLYINNENDEDYIVLHLIGHYYDMGSGYSNRNGIGAKVLVYEEGYIGDDDYLLGYSEIEAHGGYCGQDSIDAEFGIPQETSVDILVIWPGSDGSHIEECWFGVNKSQFLTLHEGQGIPDEILLTDFNAKSQDDTILLTWSANPTEGEQISGFNLYRRENISTDNKSITERKDDHLSVDLDTNWTKINTSLITGENPCSYIDSSVERGKTYQYRLEAVVEKEPMILGTTKGRCELPIFFEITSIHPNPVKDEMNITISTQKSTDVKIDIYDVRGRLIESISLGEIEVGENSGVIQTSGLSNGVYIIKAIAGFEVSTAKMVVAR